MTEFDGSTPERRLSPDGRSAQDARIYLYCVRCTVRLVPVLDSPALMAAVVEDTCLRIAVQDWHGRLPSRRHRGARIRWEAEGAFLCRQAQRLAAVTEQALAATPGARPQEC